MSKQPEHSCLVLIPIYKDELNEVEQQTISNIREKLKDFPFHFIAPGNIKEDYYRCTYPDIRIRTYDKWRRESIDDYNALMLDVSFYQGFADYDFVFIFQTDGWFLGTQEDFRHFLSMDIDYIGAPWGEEGFRFCKRIIPGAGKYRLLYLLEQGVTCYVGNGGVSLRRVSQMIHLLQESSRKIKKWDKAEDLFISYYAQKSKCNFKIPSKTVAEQFALEMNMKDKIEAGNVPMAVHKWELFYPSLLTDYVKRD